MTNSVSKRLTTEDVVNEIVLLLEAAVYRPGDRLREQELADRFGVSRGPIREALRVLEAKSLVKIEPMRGAYVTRLSDKDVQETVEISAALFGLAARKAAGCPPESLAKMRRQLEALKALVREDQNSKDFFLQTVRIGVVVMVTAKSDRLSAFLTDIRIGAPNFYGPLGFSTLGLREIAYEKWQAMINSIESNEPEMAARMAREVHIDSLRAALKIVG